MEDVYSKAALVFAGFRVPISPEIMLDKSILNSYSKTMFDKGCKKIGIKRVGKIEISEMMVVCGMEDCVIAKAEVEPTTYYENLQIIDPEKTLTCFSNLLSEIQFAGGAVCCFSWEGLKEMSAAELIVTLGQNNIKFRCVRE